MSFEQKLAQMLELNKGKRIFQFEHQGQRYWLKQAEKLKGFMRVLKGNAQKALRREMCALQRLSRKHAAVPKMVCHDADFFVLEDSGVTIKDWLSKDISQDNMQQILNDSSKALAELHSMGLNHGRPALRDICWNNGQVTFIDFESKFGKSSEEQKKVRDLVLYIHSLYRSLGPQNEIVEQAIQQYRDAGGEWVWLQTQDFLRSWQWLYYVSFPFRNNGGRDSKPVYWVLRHFRYTV
ncbi:lipopolysaccharide kinase InaA family protein [Parashewanella spongiae]|nr:lipopolysaccharide kinase InaA family protein [Parashewanella spongiae]